MSEEVLVIKPQYYDSVICYRITFVSLFVSFIFFFVVFNFVLLKFDIWEHNSSTLLLFVVFAVMYFILHLFIRRTSKKHYSLTEYRIGSEYIETFSALFGFKEKKKVLFKNIREVIVTQNPFQNKKNISTIKVLTNAVSGSDQDSSMELRDIENADVIYDKIMLQVSKRS